MRNDAQKEYPLECFLCNGKMEYFLDGYDILYKTTEKRFKIYKCEDCKVEQLLPVPEKEEVRSFYPPIYYSYNMKLEVGKSKKGIFIEIKEKIIDLAYNKDSPKDIYYYFALMARPFFGGLPLKYVGNNNFLDVGCGDGYNLNLMAKYGWNSYGFEIGGKGIKNRIYYDTNLSNVDFGNLKFDYIRVWHVLEHVSEPMSFVGKLSLLLSDKGELIIGIPNTGSLYAFAFGKYWYNRDIPRHINNYNVKNVELLLNKYGLKIVKVKYQSAGGFLGSLQHLINNKMGKNINIINNILLFLLSYPLDVICNLLRVGDCVFVIVKKSNE